MNRHRRVALGGVAVVCGLMVVWATRGGPRLSPDSMTYLAVADHVRRGDGIVDITGEPIAIFPPVFPFLLAPGGTSLLWARVVSAASAAVATYLMGVLLARRVRPAVAIAGAGAFGCSQGLLNVTATVWSEGPFIAMSLAVLVVLAPAGPMSTRRAAIGGALAASSFLTRYAGAGVVVTGLVMVAAAAARSGRAAALRRVVAYSAAGGAVAAVWLVRNLVRTRAALGPRFEGGSSDSPGALVRRPLLAIGQLVVGPGHEPATLRWVGAMAVAALVAASVVVLRARPLVVADAGMAIFALTALVVPTVARALSANDVEARVMSPMVVPLVYFGVLAVDRLLMPRRLAVAGAGLAVLWSWQGWALAARLPTLPSNGARDEFSAALHDAVDALPADAVVLTNNLHRVWYLNRRDPVLFAFTRPRPGNSHFPLTATETLAQACTGRAYLAWFRGLNNAGPGRDPRDLRPDVAQVVALVEVEHFGGGELYQVVPSDPAGCPGLGRSDVPAAAPAARPRATISPRPA